MPKSSFLLGGIRSEIKILTSSLVFTGRNLIFFFFVDKTAKIVTIFSLMIIDTL